MKPWFQLVPNESIALAALDDGKIIEADAAIVKCRCHDTHTKEKALQGACGKIPVCTWDVIIVFLGYHEGVESKGER